MPTVSYFVQEAKAGTLLHDGLKDDSQAADHGIGLKGPSNGGPGDQYRKNSVNIGLHGIQSKDCRIYCPAGRHTKDIGTRLGRADKYFSFFFVLFVFFVV